MAANERERQLDDLGDRIADGIAAGLAANAPPKRIKPGSSLFDPKTPFRSKKGPTLKGDVYLNGIRLNQDQLTDHEIDQVNKITRPGRYINRIVEVVVSTDGGTMVKMIRYSDKEVDQRLELMSHWRSFTELVDLIVKEQSAVVAA